MKTYRLQLTLTYPDGRELTKVETTVVDEAFLGDGSWARAAIEVAGRTLARKLADGLEDMEWP